nr:hypothetical protein GCM10025730_13960 [Promicromonospora thailandica]
MSSSITALRRLHATRRTPVHNPPGTTPVVTFGAARARRRGPSGMAGDVTVPGRASRPRGMGFSGRLPPATGMHFRPADPRPRPTDRTAGELPVDTARHIESRPAAVRPTGSASGTS